MSSSTVNRYVVSNATESSRTERAEADVYEFAVAVGLQLRETAVALSQRQKQKGASDPSVTNASQFVDFAVTSH